MFDITSNKGFHMTFANGWTVSVQWGKGNYCDNKYIGKYGETPEPSTNAEIAAWDANGEWMAFGNEDTMKGYCSPEEVAAFIAEIAAR